MKISPFLIKMTLVGLILFCWWIPSLVWGQKNIQMKTQDRIPAVAGMFYESDSGLLRKHLQQLFSQALAPIGGDEVAALLVPHAGYVYSGGVAASAFNQIPAGANYKRVFLIGSSHRMASSGASVYAQGDYLTPLGRVEVDVSVARSLQEASRYFSTDAAPHLQEHSLEVQLPFLQYHLKHPFKLVPIVLGTQEPRVCAKIAEALKPWFGPDNLFVISTDFSHYPSYEDALEVDEHTVAAILENNPGQLLEVLDENSRKKIPGLATSLCGWTSVLTLLNLTQGESNLLYRQVDYKNSGDSRLGDHERVVGYQAVAVFRKKSGGEKGSMTLNDDEKSWLLKRARQSLEAAVEHQTPLDPTGELPYPLTMHAGAFVSLYLDGALRGCIGSFEDKTPLWKVVDRMTASAAMKDPRFLPLSPHEVDEVVIEVSVLTPRRKVDDVSEIVPGKHGIVVEKNGNAGTFLPQVGSRYGWSREEFLGHCARDKAHIGWDGWKDASVFVFEAIVFKEEK
jgi:AmmeMemoRadiSam system protein B/AmmeMemoRadiSam system protein A